MLGSEFLKPPGVIRGRREPALDLALDVVGRHVRCDRRGNEQGLGIDIAVNHDRTIMGEGRLDGRQQVVGVLDVVGPAAEAGDADHGIGG